MTKNEFAENEVNNDVKRNSVTAVERWLNKYVVFHEKSDALVISLWIHHTYCWQVFSNLPYLNVTALTKRSGKTLVLDLIGFASANAYNLTAVTAATIRRMISNYHPTVLIDEAEGMSSESASTVRQILAVGYRKGAKVPFPKGRTGVELVDVFCPKAFAMIGDIQDVIRDRSIVVQMMRSIEHREEFIRDVVEFEGEELRESISDDVEANKAQITDAYTSVIPSGLESRERDIWKPLFALCFIFAPERIAELTRAAADMTASKTADARKFTQLLGEGAEQQAQQDEYALMLLRDMKAIFDLQPDVKYIATTEIVDALKDLDAAPWRKFRGKGIDADEIAALLKPKGAGPKPFRKSGTKQNDSKAIVRGYSRDLVIKAFKVMCL